MQCKEDPAPQVEFGSTTEWNFFVSSSKDLEMVNRVDKLSVEIPDISCLRQYSTF
jgi:hypothetical protein